MGSIFIKIFIMTKEEKLIIINEAIKQTKTNLKPLGYNLIFWSIVVISMSLFHYFFPKIVQYKIQIIEMLGFDNSFLRLIGIFVVE